HHTVGGWSRCSLLPPRGGVAGKICTVVDTTVSPAESDRNRVSDTPRRVVTRVSREGPTTRQTRAKGRASRQKILEAAAAVAGERGYDGTTIALVSRESGLSASSIYWHFADKDALLAGETWLGQVPGPDGESLSVRDAALCQGVARTHTRSPDSLRLGLMRTLGARPTGSTARETYQRLRREAVKQIAAALLEVRPRLGSDDATALATYALAGGDGIFLSAQIGDVDVERMFALHAEAMIHLIEAAAGP